MADAQRPKAIEEAVENVEKEVKEAAEAVEAVKDAVEASKPESEPEPKEMVWKKNCWVEK
jgi:hypothetical protein